MCELDPRNFWKARAEWEVLSDQACDEDGGGRPCFRLKMKALVSGLISLLVSGTLGGISALDLQSATP